MAEKILAFRVDVLGVSQEAQEIAKLDQQMKNLHKTQKDIQKAREKGNISRKNSEKLLGQLSSRTQDLRVKKSQLLKVEKQSTQIFQAQAGSVNQLQLQTAKLRDRMNQLNLTTKQGQKEWKKLNAQMLQNQATLRKYNGRLSGSARLQGAFSKGLLGSVKSMASAYLGVTALIKVFGDLVRITGDFDTATAKLASVTGSTREEIADLTEEARKLGSTTIFTASQVTDLQISLAKLGFTAEEIQNATASVLDFAAATDADLGQAAKVAGVAVRAFGLDTLETADAVSTLAVATTKSALAFEDYETILSTVGPVAKSYGFTIEDTIALTGKLRDAGFDASKAATATRNILLNLADANGDLAKSLGGSVGTFDELIDGLITLDAKGISLAETLELTDKRSVAAFNQFLAGAESTRELREEITGVNDDLEDMVDVRLDSFAGDVKALSSAWEGFILRLKASGVLREVVQFMKDAVLQVSNLDLAFRKFNKQSEEQLTRSFDMLAALSNRQGQEFDAVIEKLDEIDYENLILNPEVYGAQFAEIRNINEKEGVALAEEYIRRRYDLHAEEFRAEQAKNARIAEDAEAQARKTEAEKLKAADERRAADLKAEQDQLKAYIEQARFSREAIKKLREESVKEDQAAYDGILGILSDEALIGSMDQMQKELDAQIAVWDEESQEFKKKEEDQLAIVQGIEAQKEYIRRKALELLDASFSFLYTRNQKRMEDELEALGDNEEEKEKIRKKYAKKEQAIAITQAVIGTALSVINALQTQPFLPLGPIMAALAAALGAVQIATIANQSFATGGVVQPGSELPGSSPGADNTLALVKPGEVILNKRQQSVIGGPAAFKRAGVPGFATGGLVGSPSPSTAAIDQQVVAQKMLGEMRVILNVNELNAAQDELNVINETSGL